MSDKRKIETFLDIVGVMQRLRSEDGCPWDKKQSHKSLVPYLIEEAYELVEAIEEEDPKKVREELGDVFLQVLFHCQIAEEKEEYDIADVFETLSTKLKYRHPHVFGDLHVTEVKTVHANWEKLKKKEKPEKKSILEGIPKHLPALLKAHRIQSRASKVGFDWEEKKEVLEKIREEIEELKQATHDHDKDKIEEEFGDLLFTLVNYARFLEVHPEQALQKTIVKFLRRFRHIENELYDKNVSFSEMSLEELDSSWNEAKRNEKEQQD